MTHLSESIEWPNELAMWGSGDEQTTAQVICEPLLGWASQERSKDCVIGALSGQGHQQTSDVMNDRATTMVDQSID